jgi:hypothetical protein
MRFGDDGRGGIRREWKGLAVALTFVAAPAFAAVSSSPGGGVDDSNGVFQLEGNAKNDTGICYCATCNSSGGPSLALGYPTCPSGFTAVAFGPQTEDWQDVFTAFPGNTTHSIATSFVSDSFNANGDNIYTGGSTKDGQDISGWLWKNGKPQGKDDIEHAYAAAYTRADGHTIIVAGADRYDNAGDSTMGFWFVQDPTVGSGVTASCGLGSGCSFGGKHTDGDLLIVSDFSTGGSISSIAVYLWGGNTANLVTTIKGNEIGECNVLTGSKALCGIVNPVNVDAPWTFTDKHLGTTSSFETGEFIEIGLDLSAIFPTAIPCFSTFFAETRASTSLTSTLSDFTKPVSFPLCSISSTKSCSSAAIALNGETVTYNFTGTITAKGAPLNGVSVVEQPDNNTFVSPGTTCQTNGTGCGVIQGSLVTTGPCSNPGPYTTSNPCTQATTVTPTTTLYYGGSFASNFASDTFPNTAKASGLTSEGVTLTHDASWSNVAQACPIRPAGCLSLVPYCSTKVTSGSPLSVTVSLTGNVPGQTTSLITNNTNVAVSGITVSDPNGTFITLTCPTTESSSQCSGSNGSLFLAPGAFAIITGSYVTSTCTPSVDGRCLFTDTLSASGVGALGAGTIDSSGPGCSQMAHCHLCPASNCSTGD